ncbi:MAG: AraC family transcriptional regulator [Clostridia bacterium]|nr:AraC family transcriptional regulator [Clostridia bacterium]
MYTSEGLSERYIHLNNCGRQILSRSDTHTVRPHGRVDYHILYIVSGVCYATIDGREYTVKEGMTAMFLPNRPQEYRFLARDKSESVWIHFTGVGCEQYLRELGIYDKPVLEVGKSSELIGAVNAMLRTKALTSDGSADVCDGYLMLVLSIMARDARLGRENEGRFSEVTMVADYMSRYYKTALPISEYAAKCHLSKSRFEHVFKEHMGTTPMDYLFRIRIEAAKNLLESTELRISRIAEEVGFADANYFARVFKKYTGDSPAKYRNKYL